MNNKELLSQVVNVVEEVGQVLLELQPKVKEIKKEGKDFLTDLDLESDSLFYKKLQKLTPEIPIYSEEGKKEIERTEKAIWIVDPLDGTVNFSHQDVFWGLSVALVENQQTQLGVVYLPALEQLVGVNREGEVVTKGNIVLKVREIRDISRSQIWLDWGKESKSVLSILPKIAEVSLYPQIRLCCSASLLTVAGQKISAYIHPHPGPEDIAAGCLIVEKAGGRVTDLNGNQWTPFSDSIVASNGFIHDQILRAIK